MFNPNVMCAHIVYHLWALYEEKKKKNQNALTSNRDSFMRELLLIFSEVIYNCFNWKIHFNKIFYILAKIQLIMKRKSSYQFNSYDSHTMNEFWNKLDRKTKWTKLSWEHKLSLIQKFYLLSGSFFIPISLIC